VPFGSVTEAIKGLYEQGYTRIFTKKPFSAEEIAALSGCHFTKCGVDPLDAVNGAVAYLQNPLAPKNGRLVTDDGKVLRMGMFHLDVRLLEKWSEPAHSAPQKTAVGTPVAEDDRIITKAAVRYYPLSLAAQMAQAPPQTLLSWIRNKTKFDGEILQTYDSPTAGKIYLSENSIGRVANRFVKWPSNLACNAVVLGQTKDQTGYIRTSSAARIIGVSPRTMWLWASQGKAPTDTPLDVIKCTTSNYFYIREKDVYELKSLIPRSGLQRGRRPHTTPQP
jgi:hypothetical protein